MRPLPTKTTSYLHQKHSSDKFIISVQNAFFNLKFERRTITQIPRKVEVKGIKILTSKQLAEEYGATTQKIKQNFANNRNKFIEGKHETMRKSL